MALAVTDDERVTPFEATTTSASVPLTISGLPMESAPMDSVDRFTPLTNVAPAGSAAPPSAAS